MKSIIAVLLLAVSAFASAQNGPRHIDFTTVLKGMDGKPLLASAAKDAPPLTLGEVCVNALETIMDSDRQMSGAEKFKLDDLARRIFEKSDVVLSAEDIATLKERVGKVYGPLVVGNAWRLLDPAVELPKTR